jgi:hypothetical protein
VLVLENERYVRSALFARNDTLRSRALTDLEVPLADVFRAG